MKPWLFISLLIAWGTYFALTFASTTESAHLSKLIGDNENGAYVFDAAGCASCHMVKGSEDRLSLAGGQSFETEFGIFYAPNVSTNPTYGIGDWGLEQFAAALRDGVSAEGEHYFPAFPYTDYAKMTDQDVVDLWTFWQTLPAVETANKTHEIFFPFSIRRNLGVWKLLYADGSYTSQEGTRGAYLVEALGHCAQCHTPRDMLGGLDKNRWMMGEASLGGRGNTPSILPTQLKWSIEEIVEYLATGFTPEYDVVGSDMAAVVDNTARLTPEDRNAIATYLINLTN